MPGRYILRTLQAGPIKWWWDENWDTTAHWHYDAWREAMSDALVAAGDFLVYRPHHAFKGAWTEEAQTVNDAALRMCHVIINMTPSGVLSEGTDSEILQASSYGALVVKAPPPLLQHDFGLALRSLIARLRELKVERPELEQLKVIDAVGYQPRRELMIKGLIEEYQGNVIRVHFSNEQNHDMAGDFVPLDVSKSHLKLVEFEPQVAEHNQVILPFHRLRKVEVLELEALAA
jgi:hypothetical protein